jgi:hypothetical protein
MDVEREVAELDRQVVRGSQFTQAVLQRLSWRVSGVEALLGGLVEELVARGVVDPAALGLAEDAGEGHDERGQRDDAGADPAPDPSAPMTTAQITWPTIAIREDPPPGADGDRPEVEVDCAARMHVCRAVCCRLKFPLSAAEVDAGVAKWDIGHPYIVRHRGDGYCVHNDPADHGCTIYADRPRVCRTYSCANDPRIWADFDNMVLNHAWIAEHLGRSDDVFLVADEPVGDGPPGGGPVAVPVGISTREHALARRR